MDTPDETSAPKVNQPPVAPDDATRTMGAAPRVLPEGAAERLGEYRILGKLGEGGMGIVYEAEQQHPKRRVAVKVLRGGRLVDEDRLRTFQREADTLARLKHPNIGAIYESGRTPEGQHFFAMELVRGETLGSWLAKREAAITTRELDLRLRLFRKIADAVHYAHQRGVIHRDLKPSNIVIGEETSAADEGTSAVPIPDVKILDFGLARITDIDVTAATMTTEVGAIKGTLNYMSPEQARGNPAEIDTRSDVYALGMILYEMLVGSRPYEFTQRSLADAVRVICEENPKPLGQRWRGVRKLDPDVETIVGKALDKEPDRRYASAAALSEDVGRYLTSQPILARPPSAFYQIRKFSRRHRAGVIGAALILVALLAGISGTTWQAIRAGRAASAEREQRVRAEASQLFALGQLALHGTEESRLGEDGATGPSVALAHAMASLDRADDETVRRFVVEALWRGPTAIIPHESLSGYGAWSVDFSPDGRWLAAGYRGGERILLWSARGGEPTVLKGHEDIVHWLRFGPKSDLLISAGGDETIRFHSVPGGKLLRTLEFKSLTWAYLVSNPDRLITATPFGARMLWQSWPLGGGQPRELESIDLTGLGANVLKVHARFDVDREGILLAHAIGEELYVVPLDRLATARPRRLGLHGSPITRIAFHPDGQHVVTEDESPDHPALLWSLAPQAANPVRELTGGSYPIALRFDASGSRLTSTGNDGVFLWDLDAPRESEPLGFRWATYGTHAAAFHPYQAWLATGNLSGVTLWSLAHGWATMHRGGFTSVRFDPGGRWLAAGSVDGKAWILPLSGTSGEVPVAVLDWDHPMNDLYDIAVESQGRFIVTSAETGGPWLVPLEGGPPRRLEGFSGGARGVAIGPQGRFVAAHGGRWSENERTIRVWNVDTGEVHVLDAVDRKKTLNQMAFTAEGDLLCVSPGRLHRWDLETRKRETLLEGNIIAFYPSPDGRHVATEPAEGVITIHDLVDGDSWDLASHGASVNSVAFGPTGTVVVTGDVAGTVRVGRITGEEPHLLMGHEATIVSLAVHPDGESIASTDETGVLRIWPMPHGEPLHTLPRDELLDRLRGLTNLRIVQDRDSTTGYRLALASFPGWDEVPNW